MTGSGRKSIPPEQPFFDADSVLVGLSEFTVPDDNSVETVAGVVFPDYQRPLSDTRAEVPVLESRTAGIAYFLSFALTLLRANLPVRGAVLDS